MSIACTNELFRCEIEDNIAVIYLHNRAFEIITELGPRERYIETLEAINQSTGIIGMVQLYESSFPASVIDGQFLDTLVQNQGTGMPPSELLERYSNLTRNLANVFEKSEKPLVAGLQGQTTLEYLGLMLSFDFRLAAHDTEAVFTNFNKGLPPGGNLAFNLTRFVGSGKAVSIFGSGEPLSSSQLIELGLVTKLVSNAELKSECIELLQNLTEQNIISLKAMRQMMQPSEDERQRFKDNAVAVFKSVLFSHLNTKKNKSD